MRAIVLLLTLMSVHFSYAQNEGAADCLSAIKLCNKELLVVDQMSGFGKYTSEVGVTDCYDNSFPETNSKWISWKVKKAGTMEFSIIPVDENDDFDFVLYRGIDLENICSSKQEIRCMASGEDLGEAEVALNSCLGITGLRMDAKDLKEQHGCDGSKDNFLAGINAVEGEVFTLYINNYQSSKGFVLELGGDFEIDNSIPDCNDDLSKTTSNGLAKGIEISELFPNPAAETITAEISLPENAIGTIQVFNTTGQILFESHKQFSAGQESVNINVLGYSNGLYFMKIKIGEGYWLSSFTKQ